MVFSCSHHDYITKNSFKQYSLELFFFVSLRAVRIAHKEQPRPACLPLVKQVFLVGRLKRCAAQPARASLFSVGQFWPCAAGAAFPVGKAAPPACSAQPAPRPFLARLLAVARASVVRFAHPCRVGRRRALRAPRACGAPQPAPLLRRGSLAPLPRRGRKALFSLRSKSFRQQIRAPLRGCSARYGARCLFKRLRLS